MVGDEVHHATQLRDHWWWRPGWRPGREFYTWHLTFEEHTELHELVAVYQDALREVPGLDLVPIEWLHLTTQGVGFADEVTLNDVRLIEDAATRHFAELPSVELAFRRPVIRQEAIALAPAPSAPLVTIRQAIRDAIATVWGRSSVPEDEDRFSPHLSVAYANTDGSASTAADALATVDRSSVSVAINQASLIILRREGHSYQWRTFARAPLGR